MLAIELENSGLPGTKIDPRYADSDGRPMGETDHHNNALIILRGDLKSLFAAFTDVYVASNIVFYFEWGNSRARRDPDILVARGVRGNHFRRSYRLWEEQVLPCTLFEISSRKTWRTDLFVKRELYARLNIPEYFVFDPEGRYVNPPLRGFQARRGVSVEMAPASDGSLLSKKLGLRLVPQGNVLRLVDLKTGKQILTPAEQAEEARQHSRAERRRARAALKLAEAEKHRADTLAAEVERLRKLLGPDVSSS